MMFSSPLVREAVRLIVFALLGAGIGLLLARPWIGVAVSLLLYSLWQAWQASRLLQWLNGSDNHDPPEGRGIWATVFDRLYHLQKTRREEFNLLQQTTDDIVEAASSFSNGVIIADAQGAIVWCNKAAQRMFSVRCPEDEGSLLINLVRDPAFVQYFQGGDYGAALEVQAPGNAYLILKVEATVFGDGYRLLLLQDITKINKLERMRVDFIANVSHELRTPLTVISGYLESFSAPQADIPAETLQRAFTQMQLQSERMLALVNDITLLSRLESEPAAEREQAIDVTALITMMVDDARCSIGVDREFKLQLNSHYAVCGEEKAIHSAFGNLIDNACKYSGPGSEVAIRWYLRGNEAVFEVEDNGVGVAEADIPHLTERFYRVDKSRSTGSGGTGLGLAIVKHALLRHDARLEISSEPGEGSIFRCVFPLWRVTEKAA